MARRTADAAALQQLVTPTRAEAGCLNYDLHRDREVPGRFLFYGNRGTRAHWEAHMVSDHFIRHKETSQPLVRKLEIPQLEPTG